MDWLSFAGSIIGGIIGGLFTFLGVKMTLKHDDTKKHQEELKKAIEERPRLEIADFKEIRKPTKIKSDFDIICLGIKDIKKAERHLEFIYDEKALNKENLVCCEYTFKNTGATEIDSICLISGLPKSMSLVNLDRVDLMIEDKLLNYDAWSNKRFIKPGEQIKMCIFYIEDQIIVSPISACIGMYIQDINGRYWHQPLFAPRKETDNSTLSSRREVMSYSDIDSAIECFKGKKGW